LLLQYVTQLLICLGLTRFLASGLEGLFFARWTLKESGRLVALYYWMAFHSIAAFLMVMVVFRFMQGQTLNTTLSLITFALVAYGTLFIVPPYRTKLAMGFRMLGEIKEKKEQESTKQMVKLMHLRTIAAWYGYAAFVAILLFRFIIKIKDIFNPWLTWLFVNYAWLYWGIAAVTGLFCLVSAFFGVQILYAQNKQRFSRRRMEMKLGRRLTQEEFMYLFVDEQQEAKAKNAK
jgi:hypothetical protein